MSKQYKSRITEQQKMILLEFIEAHPQLVSGYLTKNFSHSDKVGLWNEISEVLNACICGSQKDAESWKGCWGDLKTGVKKKLSRVKMSGDMSSEDGMLPVTPLNSFEERIAALMGVHQGYLGEKEPEEVMSCVTVETEMQQDTAVSSGTVLKEEQDSCEPQVFITDCLSLAIPPSINLEKEDAIINGSAEPSTLSIVREDIMPTSIFAAPKRKRTTLEEAEAAVGSCAAAQAKQASALQQLAETTRELVDYKRRKLELTEKMAAVQERRLAAEEQQASATEKKADLLERKLLLMERRAAAEERRVAAEERRVATEERRVAAEERRVVSEERRIVVEERKVTAEERKAATLERIENILLAHLNK